MKAKEDLTEHFVSREEVFTGRLLQRAPRHRAHARRRERDARVHRPSRARWRSCRCTANGNVMLERQYRYPHGRDFIEIPAGKVEAGEDLLGTAQRELLEETGYAAGEWQRLTTIHNAISYSDEAIELFLARGLDKRTQKLDAEEFLEVLEVPFAEAIAMMQDGRITDVKTMIALFWARDFVPGISA